MLPPSLRAGRNATALSLVLLVSGALRVHALPPDPIWTWLYDSGFDDRALSIASDGAGAVYVGGAAALPPNPRDMTIVEYGMDGVVGFVSHYDGGADDFLSAIALDGVGHLYGAGESFLGGDYDITLAKWEVGGDLVWARSWDFGDIDHGTDLAIDRSGDLYVVGETGGWVEPNLIVVKFDSAGDTLWTRSFDSGYDDWIAQVALDSAGAVFLAGNMYVGDRSAWNLIKYDWDGSMIWSVTSDTSEDATCWDVKAGPGGGVYLTGSQGIADRNVAVHAFDPYGNPRWNQSFDWGGDEEGQGLAIDAAGAVFVVGHRVTNKTLDPLLLKLTSDGEPLWIYDPDFTEDVMAFDVAVDRNGYLFVAAARDNGVDYDFKTDVYAQYLSIGGRVCHGGVGLPGVEVVIEGGLSGSCTTDSDGAFRFDGLPCAYQYRVFPSAQGYSFSPPDYTYPLLGYDFVNQDFDAVVTAIPGAHPARLTLSVPSPVLHEATVSVSLPVTAGVTLDALDLSGRLVETLADGIMAAGAHLVRWAPARSGVYVIRLETVGACETRRVVAIR
ncbi:MAG: hypothetical protein MUE60_06880 [Candidatus Eisenbacteria bacterium]|jgi:hypothetical protein|nr:hypothetical protein [Candidatus Eisenbacteria bacterium]